MDQNLNKTSLQTNCWSNRRVGREKVHYSTLLLLDLGDLLTGDNENDYRNYHQKKRADYK